MTSTDMIVAQYLKRYEDIRETNFPLTIRHTHWQIINALRLAEEGLCFSSIRGRLDAVFGLDEETSARRVAELSAAGLVQIDGSIHASTVIFPTENLIINFDRHVVDAVKALFVTANHLGADIQTEKKLSASHSLNKRFCITLKRHEETWSDHTTKFLRNALPKQTSRQLKAHRKLLSYPYWYIFLKSWMSRYPDREKAQNHLRPEDFQMELFPKLKIPTATTTSYMRDMIQWKILERQTAKNGVRNNHFAVRMADEAFEHFSKALIDSAPILIESARDLASRCAGHASEATTRDAAATILKFAADKENVTATSPKGSAQKSGRAKA